MYKEHFDAFVETWNDGNIDRLDRYASPDVTRTGPKTMNTSANDLAELKTLITDFRQAFPNLHVTIDEALFQDNRSFARWTFTGTHTGEGTDIPPTNKSVELTGCSVHRYEDGKLIEEFVFYDALEFMSQLGVIEAPKTMASSG